MNLPFELPAFAQNATAESVMSLAALAAAVVALLVVKQILARRLAGWADRHVSSIDPALLSRTLSSAFWLTSLIAAHIAFGLLPLGKGAVRYGGHAFTILYAFTVISVLINTVSFIMDVLLRRKGSSLSTHKGRVLLPVLKGMAWILGLSFILENFGMEVSTILAGLGVAGVAVGFAAQAVLGDLFSYFAILFDTPFRIGDFVMLDNEFRGHIEHIGLKTSRLRSLDGEQIILSNSDLTNSRVKNYRRMTRRRILFRFGVLYSTPADKLEALPGIVWEIIDRTPRATFDRAHFQGFGDSSLDFEVVYFVESPEMVDYMDTQHIINLALVRAFEKHGLEFAFPTRTVHVHQEGGEPYA